jgi:hypothetical protein
MRIGIASGALRGSFVYPDAGLGPISTRVKAPEIPCMKKSKTLNGPAGRVEMGRAKTIVIDWGAVCSGPVDIRQKRSARLNRAVARHDVITALEISLSM